MRLHFNSNNISLRELDFFYHHARLWLDVSICPNSRYVFEQLVCYIDRMNKSIIIHTKEQITRLTVIRQVIRKRTYSLTQFIGIGSANSSLYTVTL